MAEHDSKNVSYQPSEGLCYDPSQPKFWEQAALEQEVTRTFEVCHGCRMCFKYCDSFPRLFDLLDNSYDGDVRKISRQDTEHVFSACFQCKLCEVQCPYTAREEHEFQLDFPMLAHRHAAIQAKEKGVAFRERLLANPDGAGKQARLSLGLVNLLNRFPPQRWLMEKVLGIHRHKLLPPFASSTFESWAKRRGLLDKGPGGEAVLFQTCYVQNNEPQVGRDVIEVLEHNQVDVRCQKGLKCCGMPAWEHGDLETLRRQAHENLDRLLPSVERGAKVLAINPTCSMMLRQEYPNLLEGEDRARAEKLAPAVMDPSEFLWSIRNEERFKSDVKTKTPPGQKLAYHAPCHLRVQRKGFKGRDLLRKVLGVEPTAVMECCGHNGTYAMKVEGFESSQRVGKKAFEELKACGTELCATDCPLAAIQFEQHAGVKPLHPLSILARAYRGDPLPGVALNDDTPDVGEEAL